MRKLLKKSLACILTAIICVSLCVVAVPASAAAPAYSTLAVEAKAGETVDVTFTVSNFADVKGAQIKFFLPEVVASIEAVECNAGELVPYADGEGDYEIDAEAKSIKLIALFGYEDELAAVDTLVLTATVVIAEDAADGTYGYAAPEIKLATATGYVDVDEASAFGKFEIKNACTHTPGEKTLKSYSATQLVYSTVCTACGEAYDMDPIAVTAAPTNVKFGHSLVLQSDITLNFTLTKANVTGYTNIFGVFKKEVFNGNTSLGYEDEFVVIEATTSPYDSTKYIFQYQGVGAIEMASNIDAFLFATDTKGNVVCFNETYSIATYALAAMKSASVDALQKTAIADMINYGSASQTRFGYNTGKLANTVISAYLDKASTLLTSFESQKSSTGTADAVSKWTRGLELEYRVFVRLRFVPTAAVKANPANYTLKITYKDYLGKSQEILVPCDSEDVVWQAANNRYEYTFDTLNVVEFSTVYTATIVDNTTGADLGLVFNDSVQSYASDAIASSGVAAAEKTLIKYLMTYSASAKYWFENK